MTDFNKREVLFCDCMSVEHQIVVTYCTEEVGDKDERLWEDCMEIQVHLNSSQGFWRRLFGGIKYAFGHRSKYGEWDNFLVNKKTAEQLMPYLQRLISNANYVQEVKDGKITPSGYPIVEGDGNKGEFVFKSPGVKFRESD